MPKSFEDCIKRGGRVVTKKMSGDRYMRICYLGLKSYPGEVKKAKKK